MTKQKRAQALTRKQKARKEKEQQIQRTLTWIAVGVLAAVIIILGYGFITELVIKAGKPVARVDDIEITTQEYQNRLRYERELMNYELQQYRTYISQFDPSDESVQSFLQQLQLSAANLERQLSPDLSSILGGQILDQMIEEELVRQETKAREITVSQDEVERQVELLLGYDRDAIANQTTISGTETVTGTTPTMTEEDYETVYQNFKTAILEPSSFSEDTYRKMIATDLLRQQLRDILAEDVQSTADQVQVTVLITGTEEAGVVLRDRINVDNEDPATLLEELNIDDDSLTSGFTLPWLPLGYLTSQLGPDLERLAFNTPVGKAAEPILGPGDRYYVIFVDGHEERELSEDLLADSQEQKYNEWLTLQKEERSEYLEWEQAVLTEP